MGKIKVAINGFGRIGRNVFKLALENENLVVVGINDLTDTKTLAHLLKYDSTQGQYPGVSFDDVNIIVNGAKFRVTAERSPANIPWAETPDVVIESTGVFRAKESAKGGYGDHLKNGAKKLSLLFLQKIQLTTQLYLA
jgi:glyceraldehyde 3-phosphate dehydrogenase